MPTAQKGIQKKGYRITVRGEYRAALGRDKNIQIFRDEVFILPEIVQYREGRTRPKKNETGQVVEHSRPIIKRANALRIAQKVLMRYYLPDRLKNSEQLVYGSDGKPVKVAGPKGGPIDKMEDKYPGFISVRKMYIVKKEKIKLGADQIKELENISIQDMNEAELLQFCAFQDIDVVLDHFGDLADKKIAIEHEYKQILKDRKVMKRVEDPESFKLSEPENMSPKNIDLGDERVFAGTQDLEEEDDKEAEVLG